MKTYHLGMVKQGRKLILEVADTVDQLNCELWRYYGERQISIARLRRERHAITALINIEQGMTHNPIIINRIHRNDFSAGC